MVVYDSLAQVVNYEYDGGILTETYEGFRVEEEYGKQYVVFKEATEQGDVERRYVLPEHGLETFLALAERYREDYFARQKWLFTALVWIEQQLQSWTEGELREICNSFYVQSGHYVHFVAMNMVKSEFFSYARERIFVQPVRSSIGKSGGH